MARVFLPQYIQGFFELVLLDLAMGGQVAAGGTVVDKVMLSEEALGSSVIAGREMNLGQEKGVFSIT